MTEPRQKMDDFEIAAELMRLCNAAPAATTRPTLAATPSDAARWPTDMGNAQRLVSAFGKDIRYCPQFGQWLIWDGNRWRRDDVVQIVAIAKQVARTIYSQAWDNASDDQAAAVKWALKSQARERLAAMVDLAKCEVPVRADALDADPMLFAVSNGTIDLKSGTLRPARREDLITLTAPVEFHPDAECPKWLAYLDLFMHGDAELIAYLQRIAGASLTADIRDQAMFVFYGTGSNGKSTFVDTMLHLLGGYAGSAPPGLLTLRKGSTEHPTEIADLKGKRLIVASEGDQGGKLNVPTVKRLTGDSRLKARFMREDYFEFERTFKILYSSNHKPRVAEQTHAIWRRLKLVPFGITIEKSAEIKDYWVHLRDAGEWPGILAWAVRGCLAWQRDGLGEPAQVTAATAEYRIEQDTLGEFFEQKCIIDPRAKVTRALLYSAYEAWAQAAHERFWLKKRDFFERIRGRLDVHEAQDRHEGHVTRFFFGIGLSDNTYEQSDLSFDDTVAEL